MLDIAMIAAAFYLAFLCWLILSYSNDKKNAYVLSVSVVLSIVWIVMILGLKTILGSNIYYDRAIFAVGLLSILSLFNFVTSIARPLSSLGKVISRAITYFLLLIFVITLITDLIVASVFIKDGMPVPLYGSLIGLYYLAIGLSISGVVYIALFEKRSLNQKTQKQLQIVAWTVVLTSVLAFTTNIIVPNITQNTDSALWLSFSATVLTTGMSYAILKYGLFDIKLAAVRTAGYLLTVAVMAIFYVMSAYSLSLLFFKENVTTGVSSSPINVALALALALIFQPIKNFFDKLTNNIFYRGEYEQDKFIRQFGKILSYDTDLKLLLNKVSLHIAENLKAEQVFFYVKDRGIYGKYSPAHPKFTDHDIKSLINYSTHIQISSGSEVIMANHIKNVHLGRLINKQKIKIILPLKLQSEIIGFLFVGEHLSRGFSIRDVKTLDSIANELTIAVQNSLSVEEVRDLNENLQRKVNQATKELLVKNRQLKKLDEAKDEFMSIASHQLRTPLTSIKGYLDMVLDGDLGEVKPKQKTVLSEAFMSSERMVQLINDFLNVSRLQTGKFVIEKRKSDLAKILREEIRLLSVVAKQRQIKFKTKITDNLPTLNIDADKLRQVMINMIDNAIYYSREDMTVTIELGKIDGQVVFRVIDTGIGVPEIDQSELFTKFFRASNARKKRPDGTGVGLFLARKVILAHGGEVIFKSIENKGSTFGFSLPIN